MNRLGTIRSSVAAQSAGSPCRMEALEPRLLLANELIVGLGDAIFREPQLPGDKIEVPVTFQNVSGAQVSGKIHIRIYASDDGGSVDLDEDFLIADKFVNINPRPNQIQTKTVKGQFPLDMLPEDYQLIVVVDEGDSMLPAGVTFAVSADIDEEIFDLRWQFGTVSGRSGNTTLRFMNNSGVIYKINFSAGFDDDGEFGEIFSGLLVSRDDRGTPIPGDQFIDLLFDHTGFDDRISVRRTGGPSDPDLFYLTGIEAENDQLRGGSDDLGFFDASDLTLYGRADFEGLHKLFLGNILDAEEVDIDNEIGFWFSGDDLFPRELSEGQAMLFSDRVSIKVKDVVGTQFDIQGTLANMQALSFSGFIGGSPEPLSERGEEGLGGIEANFIDKVNIAGDFEGFVVAESFLDFARIPFEVVNYPDRAINAFIVEGTLTGGLLTLGAFGPVRQSGFLHELNYGDVAKLQAGAIGDFEAVIFGRLERLIVKNDLGFDEEDPKRGFAFDTIIGANQISRVEVGGSVIDSQVFAGLDGFAIQRGGGYEFGAFYEGVADEGDVQFTSGIIGRINVGGDVVFSEFAAGVTPELDLRWAPIPTFFQGYLNGDSSVSHIGPVKVGGEIISKFPAFTSGDFPDNVSIGGSSYSTVTNPDDFFRVVFPLV